MSKSKGNVINPLEMIDKYGADALRMALVFGTGAGNDQALSEDKIRGMRNFANKLWNIGRFIEMCKTDTNAHVPSYSTNTHAEFTHKNDKRILTETNLLTAKVTKHMETYRFSDAAKAIYAFAWHRIADIYLEKNKDRLRQGDVYALATLTHVYQIILSLLHPIMPFVTESIWGTLHHEQPLIVSEWPGLTNTTK